MRLRRRHPVHDGGSLRTRLLVLVLVPLIGAGAAASGEVAERMGTVRAASSAEEHIRDAAAVDAARGAFEQEVVPAFAATAAKNPSLLNSVVPMSVFRTGVAIIARLAALRIATDSAVAALATHSSVADVSRRFAAELAQARSNLDDPNTVVTALASVTSFLAAMAKTEHEQVTAAIHAGVDSAGIEALDDVDLTVRATQAAAQQIVMFSATQFPNGGDPAAFRNLWAQDWGTYAGASAAVSDQASPTVARQWNAVNATPAVGAFNRFLAAQVGVAATVPIAKMIELIIEDGKRNQAYLIVLDSTVHRALAAGRTQRHDAIVDLAWIIAAALLLVILSMAIAVLIRRSVTKPLSRLAEQATRISLGELTDVQVSGPREVRTVARALSSSVAGLRNVEAQAAAVAAGDLDNPVVRLALPGPLGQVVHSSVASIISAINEREIAQLELAHRAAHDALTELPNRAQALFLIEQALHRAQRSSTKTALMFLDLDHFKAINDNFGHAAGDEVLKSVASRMLRVVRDGDSVARLGGDEFIVLLENIDDEADVVKLAERLIEHICAELVIEARAFHVGASVGVAFCRDGYIDADRLLQEADAAAYRAKKAGRGRVDVFDDGLRTELKRRAELEQAIAAGLDRDEFVLHYQAVVDLKTGDTVGVEALIRWLRPAHGLVPPDDFIPIAEQSTLINDIGRWVLNQATGQLARWDRVGAGPSQLSMAVNISGRHLSSKQLLSDVSDALAVSGIDPRRLVIELTETVGLEDPIATRNIQDLRAMGVQFAVDDFGAALNSIYRLPTLPVDTLKIDRALIASSDRKHNTIVRLIVAAAHSFGLSVVAEGIEHEQQADRLRDADVERGQGFLYAHPQPPTAQFPRLFPTNDDQDDASRASRDADIAVFSG